MKKKNLIFEYSLAFIIRLALRTTSLSLSIKDRVEISTPLNSWKRVEEGIELVKVGVDPFIGDMVHETPIMLEIFGYFTLLPTTVQHLIFVGVDLFTAFILLQGAKIYLREMKKQEDNSKTNGKIAEIDAEKTPILVSYSYLFNPFIILNCAASTTTVFSNFLFAVFLFSLITKKMYPSIILLSFLTLQSFYSSLLIAPLCIRFSTKSELTKIFSLYGISLIFFLFLCFSKAGNWLFIDSLYNFILNVHDLTPNVGLFWYFFTEMFEHFRALFISALQINATVLYLIPLSLHLKKDSIFLSFILISLTVVFKSYPCIGEVGFYLALLPLWRHLFFFVQQLFVVGCIFIITSVLGPTVWHLWIYSGSANANFFFGVTLAFATAQIFLITDLLFAHKKREFALKNGWPDDSSKNVLILD